LIAQFIHTATSFIAAHPHWIGFAVFAATALESMAFIGSLFPGMSLVLGLSGIAASLGADVWVLVLWCTFGAIVGDGVSFWIGHRFGDHLKSMWPFRTRPGLLDRGVEFFRQNGGKSIVIGRFLPFTRAVVPIAAGMLGMNPVRFYVANVLSAIGWALMNVVPAAGVGLAFAVINETSSRVAVLLGVFLAIFVMALMIGHVTARLFLPWLDSLFAKVGGMFENGSGRAARLLAWVFAPNRSQTAASAAWVLFALGFFISFAKVLEDVVTGDPLVRADVALNALMQGLRTPIGDRIMIVVTSMGDMMVVLWAFAVLLGGLLLFRAWRTFGLAVLALAATSLFVPLLKWTLHKPRPIDLYSGIDAFSFPSGHAAFAGVLWGLIAVIGSRGLSRNARATLWAVAFTISMLIGLSRIYLSAHWPSDVIGGLSFGWAMAGLFGLFEARLGEPVVRPALLGLATTIGLTVAWGIHATASFDYSTVRYAPRERAASLSLANWIETGWQEIPTARIDLRGEYEEALVFQAATSADKISNVLQAAGWSQAPTMGWGQATQFFNGRKELKALLPLPLLHNGRPALLTMIMDQASGQRRNVLRFWRSGIRIGDIPGRPMILAGSLTLERVVHPIIGINVLRDKPASAATIGRTIASLEAAATICLFPPSSVPGKIVPWLILPRDARQQTHCK